MKYSAFFALSFAFLFASAGALAAQPSSRSVETIIIDSFDDENGVEVKDYAARAHLSEQDIYDAQPSRADGGAIEPERWTWKVQASRYVTGGPASKTKDKGTFPLWEYFEGIPNSLRSLHAQDAPAKILGVQVKYDRKGANWFEVYPSDGPDGTALEIPLTGTVKQFDFWVWGAKYRYKLELLVRDAEGRVIAVPVGSLNFEGWKNFIVPVPSGILQHSRHRSGPETMNFVGFRVTSDPLEYADDFVIYFDELRYVTSVLSNIYDGYDLRKFRSNSASTEEAAQ